MTFVLSRTSTVGRSGLKLETSVKRCVVLTMDCLDDFEEYDHLIEAPLHDLGWQVERISWRAQGVCWDDYDVVLIRSPWDYQDDPAAFLGVLTQIEASSAILENSLAVVKWNISKVYLKELEAGGVCIVPTLWPEHFEEGVLESAFDHFSAQQIVVKPHISANADHTYWLHRQSAGNRAPDLAAAFADRDFMIQPFMEHVLSEGEYSLFYFDGRYSHAILKTPKPEDFRVQEEHGARIKLIDPEEGLLRHAETAMTVLAGRVMMPLYARIDLVRYEEGFALMEAELIEPSLYFNMDDQSAARFAKACVERWAAL